VQAITFHLADSLPVARRPSAAEALNREASAARRARLQALLDAGRGSCALRDERIGTIVEQALFHGDGEGYRLLCWVVMPNHVHVLIEQIDGQPLHAIVRRWKSYTARQANLVMGRAGRFWQSDYFDRYIRDDRHLQSAVLYVRMNPVRAGLVQRAEDWPFSSARLVAAPDATARLP
jgi:REP element-mobilizing transposase RayT